MPENTLSYGDNLDRRRDHMLGASLPHDDALGTSNRQRYEQCQ